MRIVLSSAVDNKNLPEGWKASPRTQLSCPFFKIFFSLGKAFLRIF